MKKLRNIFKENKAIIIVLLIALVLHVATLIYLGPTYNMQNDDIRYIESGINFKKYRVISIYNNYPSAQIMPGISVLIGFVSLIFKEGCAFFLALKIIWMIFGLLSILGIYKIVMFLLENKKYNKFCAIVATIPLLFPTFLWLDNVILTETPFMCLFIYLLYFTLKEAKEHEKNNFIMILLLYMGATLLKANFAIYPITLIVYLLFKKYDRKLLIKEIFIAACVMALFFVPWTIRNYKLFDVFIPLTYGSGNPKLWGTYQGYGYPSDEEINFSEYLDYIEDENIKSFRAGTLSERYTNYYSLRIDGIHADYRIKKWWEKDKLSFIVSYAVLKPLRLMMPFYWEELFGIPRVLMVIIRIIELLIFIVFFTIIVVKKAFSKEIVFLLSNFLLQVIVYSMTFTFSRYGQTLIFILFIITALGVNAMLNSIKISKKSVKKM